MLRELLAEVGMLLTLLVFGYAVVRAYLLWRQPHLARLLFKRRLAFLALLVLLIVGIKTFEDVLGKESGVVDEMVLMFVHNRVPAAFAGFFDAVTQSGSARVLVPATGGLALALIYAKRRLEAGLILASISLATLLVYIIKALAGRARPELWETRWYWGSSFPSGHTVNTAAFATAAALCVARIWPRYGNWALAIAFAWTLLVALSRLVLGVHWPSDVLAAMCLGALIPLMMSIGLDVYRQRLLTDRLS